MILILNILFRQMYLSKSEFHSFENSIEVSMDTLVNGVGIKRDCCASTSFSSVQWLSHARLFATPWTATHQSFLSMTNSQSLLKFMSIKSVMPSSHLILCHPLLFLPSIFSSIWVFSNESVLHIRWPKYWGFSFSISPSNEHTGLISFRMDWLDLVAVQWSLLQHHSSKNQFFRAQLSL